MSSQAEHVGARRLGRRSKGEGQTENLPAEWKLQRLHVRGPHHRRQPVPPAHQATMARTGQSRSSPPSSTHKLISPLTCAYVVRELKGLAVVERVFVRPDAAPLHDWVAFFRVPTVE
jgi:hypothetical protein